MKVNTCWLSGENEISAPFKLIRRRLQLHFEAMASIQTVGKRTRAISSSFQDFSAGPEYIAQSNHVMTANSTERAPAGHRVDAILKTESQDFIAIELAFNNREAIGTNLMKLAIALEHRTEVHQSRLAVIIAPSRKLLDYGGWDRSYGEASEYMQAYAMGYCRHMKCNLLIMELDV